MNEGKVRQLMEDGQSLAARREWIDSWREDVEASSGYELMPLPDIPSWVGSGYALTAACKRCGALVILTDVHDDWHRILRQRTLTPEEREGQS